MEEILGRLAEGSRVLDLGSHEGSFPGDAYRLLTIRVDIAKPRRSAGCFVQADAAKLPFPSRTFDAVISNHSLEHFTNLKPALQEIGRVVKSRGAVFVAVPDASTVADRLYRALYRNAGEHVNLFDSSADLSHMLSWYFGLPHVATKTLCTGFTFLNRRNTTDPNLKQETLFRGIWERPLALFTGALRLLDRCLRTRTSVYGWALYFGNVPEPIDPVPRTNVCIRCGQGHPSEYLLQLGLLRRKWKFLSYYHCPDCRAPNVYTPDRDFAGLQ